ncbi:MAG: hypothetical protein E6G95_12070 [Alphaproteobacteria bacterium]|nr:MAG: hypothetical protein E6G95_12070 [Alphaproteobacteria bacterium]
MKRYVVAHWRGELPLAKSFLVNGLLGFLVLGLGLPGLGQLLPYQAFNYVAVFIWFVWEIWAAVGIVRCVFRTFREPRSTFGPVTIRRGFAAIALFATVAFVVGTLPDLLLLLQ